MENNPYFSIIIPMYNAERYIKLCINSILHQTFQDFEIIIVDDASTDDSVNICRELYGNNKKVRLLCNEKNHGPGMTRNRALEIARGEYIFFVDSDDLIIPKALEKLHKATEIGKKGGLVDAIHIKGWYTTLQIDDKPIDFGKIKLDWEENPSIGFLTNDIPHRLLENWVENKFSSFGWLYAYRRAFLKEYNIQFPIEHIYSEDHPVIIAGMCFAKKYLVIRDALSVYRVRKESLMHNTNVAYGIRTMPVLVNYYKKILEKVPELDNNHLLKEQCLLVSLDNALSKHARPLYRGMNIDVKLDQAVYNAMFPIFGENTTIAKFFFHGFNVMWRQTNILSQQLLLMQKREAVFQKQEKLIEQLKTILDEYKNIN